MSDYEMLRDLLVESVSYVRPDVDDIGHECECGVEITHGHMGSEYEELHAPNCPRVDLLRRINAAIEQGVTDSTCPDARRRPHVLSRPGGCR